MEWKSKGEGGKRQGEKNEESGKGKGEWEMRRKRKEKKCCLNLFQHGICKASEYHRLLSKRLL